MDAELLASALPSLFDESPEAIILYDRAGQFVAANAAAQLLLGYKLHDVVGQHFTQHVRDEDGGRVSQAMAVAMGGGSDSVELEVRHSSGIAIPLECDVLPARVNGEIVGVFVQARDLIALRSAEASLSVNQERFRSLFEYHPDPIMELRGDGTISRVNVALESATGFFGERIVGKSWLELIAPEVREHADEALRDAMRGEAREVDSTVLDRMGNRIAVQLKLVPLHTTGQIRGAYAVAKDVTAQQRAEAMIAQQSERIRDLYMVAASRTGSREHQITQTLRFGQHAFGFEYAYVTRYAGEHLVIDYAVGEDAQIRPGMVIPMDQALSRHLQGEKATLFVGDLDAEIWKRDSAYNTMPWRSYYAVQLVVAGQIYGALVFAGRAPLIDGIPDADRDIIALMALFLAATLERAAHEERIEQLAFNDMLTGLPNRVLFNDRLHQALATARRYGRGFAVMYLDLDRFKVINDTYGHGSGDEVLHQVAQRLQSALRESDTIARFGGDEFVVLQPIVDGPGDAADLARKIVAAMLDPIVIDEHQHRVTTSIGIALFPQDAQTVEELMDAADRALYRAKHGGRNRWSFANEASARTAWPVARLANLDPAE